MAKAKTKSNHPWVTMAVICESLLEEKDNIISTIRIAETLTVQRPVDWDGKTYIKLRLHGLLGFKAGDVTGDRKLIIYKVYPNNKREKVTEKTLTFLGGKTGVNVKMDFGFGFKTEGLYWFDVYLDKWLATRIPLTIRFA